MQSPTLNFRIILSPFKPVFPLSPPFSYPYSCRRFFTARCSSSSSRNPNTFNSTSRQNTSSTQLQTRTTPKDKRKPFMEERGQVSTNERHSFEFNHKRAQGLDYSNKPKKNLQLKVRKLNPTNTISYIQILGTGMDTQDTSTSVLLFFDKQRFIFNAGEGLQRFCTEHKIKLSKIDHIFLSRVCSETAGGLPGLLLTLAGIGDEGLSVNMWGPSDLNYMVDAMKMFVPHAAMVHTRSFGSNEDDDKNIIVLVDDEVVKISAVVLKPRSGDVKPGEISVVYICELPEIAGKFDPVKAKKCGLRAGPKYGLLQSGKSVKSDFNDSVVHPSDVMGPTVPGPIVFLVDCPSEVHLRDLLDKNYLIDKKVSCIVHLTPSSLISSPDYQSWMSKFPSAQHIMAGHEKIGSVIPIMKSSAKIATWLNYLCPQFFPATGISYQQESSSNSNLNAVSAENLLKFILRPHVQLGLDKSSILSFLSQSQLISDLKNEVPEVEEAAKSIRNLWFEPMVEEPWLDNRTVPACLNQVRRDDLEIVLLGTGSSQPSKYRNVTSIFINLFSKGGLLLDCGEGTLGQLKRRFGLDGADEIVRNLKCIWISHIHADHHSGLARILSLRRVLLKNTSHNPILVIGPRRLKRYLDAYQRLEDLNMQFLDCWSTSKESWSSERSTLLSPRRRMEKVLEKTADDTTAFALANLRNVLSEAGLESLVSFPVVHCPQAYGVSLCASERRNRCGEVIPGWKVVYSGDTRPCQDLVDAAQDATVLIHEATFEDGLMEEALARNHSTTKEATEVGDAAGAYRVVLTHFSQRYPKVPVVDDTQMHRTCVAFDLMSVNVADLHVLPKVLPYLKLLFKNDVAAYESDDVDLAHMLS